KRLVLMLSMSGSLYAVLGIVFYLYQNNNFDIKNDLGLIVALLGILITIVSFYYNLLINNKVINQKDQTKLIYNEFEVVRRWQTIEKMASALMEKDGNTLEKSNSISYLLN